MQQVEDTLNERNKSYGSFFAQSRISEDLKAIMHGTINWKLLEPDQKEAFDIIAVKIARLLNGDPNFIDGWHDIQGYARLVETRIIADKETLAQTFDDIKT